MSRDPRVGEILALLEKKGSARIRREMLTRYGITAPKAFGVRMSEMQKIAKRFGRDHELAQALWATGWYEARTVSAFVEQPERVTPAQMDRWARDFDNWAICDTVCFVLFDLTPHAWRKVAQWSGKKDEFVKRAGFALLASLAAHDKRAGDAPFLRALKLVERAATDGRNFVRKGVSWGFRGVGRRNRKLNAAATALAKKLAASNDPTSRWLGKEALRDLAKARR